MVSFNNTEVAFAYKSDKELNRAYMLFKLISYNWLVQLSPPFVNTALALHLPIKGLIRATIFRHFCGGENIADCNSTIETLGKYNIGTILDYSVEGKEREEDFDSTFLQVLANIVRAKGDKHIHFSVFKPTGLARKGLLEKSATQKNSLTETEKAEFERVKKRFEMICESAHQNDVPIYIDAEETWIQDVIDDLVTEMMMKHNKERPLIFNTIQLYRTDRLDFLKKSYDHAVKNNYYLGLKLVRGAYMEKERKRALEMGYPSPIHPDKQSSDHAYDKALRFCVEHVDRISICSGSHNEKSADLLAELMQKKGLPNNHPHIWFSQLYGMSDHISFNLARAGYNVSKYVPYGPVATVLPYLIRRAQENTSVKGQTGRELTLIQTEKRRRAGRK